ncbi:MAG: glycosyltransferase [Candidatus Aenigmarchaeota archaeon]|nr:glycosyltransferase [Candidatus Aenigmarchaeota archaeon]
MSTYFLYVNSPLSPHFVHLTWAKSVKAIPIKIPINPVSQYFTLVKRDEKIIKSDDTIIVESLYALPYLYLLKNKVKVKVISIIADSTFYPSKLPLRKYFYNIFKLDQVVDYFFTVSKEIKEWIINYGIDETKIYVVRPFSLLDVKKRLIKRKVKNKKITFIGNYTKTSAAKLIISIAEYLKDFKFYLIGTVSKKIKNPPKNVKCYMNISWEELKKILLSSSIYLHPMFFDPFPVSVLDAMRCGNFPLVYRLVGSSEILSKENIFYSLNPREIISKIIKVYKNLSTKDFLKYYKI